MSRYIAAYTVYLSNWKVNNLSVLLYYHRHLRNIDCALEIVSAFTIDISKSQYTVAYIVYLSNWKANILSVMVCYHRHLKNTNFSLKKVSAFAIDILKEFLCT